MKISLVAVVVSSMTLVGCTTLPKPADRIPISAKEIFAAVDCELKTLLDAPQFEGTTLGKWAGVANIKVTNTGDLKLASSADITASIQTPLAPVTVKTSPAGGFENKSVGILQLARPYPSLAEGLKTTVCPASDSPLATHGLGIADALAGQFAFAGNDPSSKQITSLGFTRTYTVSRSVGGGLSFTVGIVKLTADGNKASHDLETTIIVSIEPPKPKPRTGKPKDNRSETEVIQDRINLEYQNQQILDALKPTADE